jgi:hypothetical protein
MSKGIIVIRWQPLGFCKPGIHRKWAFLQHVLASLYFLLGAVRLMNAARIIAFFARRFPGMIGSCLCGGRERVTEHLRSINIFGA